MSLKVYSKAHKKEVTVTALIDPNQITYGEPSDVTTSYKVGSGAPAAYKNHNGLDTAASDGSAIYSIYDGVVRVNTYEKDGAGYYVSIGTDMNGKNYRLMYMHMKEKSKLKVGDKIKAGDLIGYQGSTGNSTGSHLHVSVKVADNAATQSTKTADPYIHVVRQNNESEGKIYMYETGRWKTKSKMNVRTGPGLSNSVIDSIEKNAVVDVYAVTSDGWGKVDTDKWFCLEDSNEVYAERVGDSEIVDTSVYENKLSQIRAILEK